MYTESDRIAIILKEIAAAEGKPLKLQERFNTLIGVSGPAIDVDYGLPVQPRLDTLSTDHFYRILFSYFIGDFRAMIGWSRFDISQDPIVEDGVTSMKPTIRCTRFFPLTIREDVESSDFGVGIDHEGFLRKGIGGLAHIVTTSAFLAIPNILSYDVVHTSKVDNRIRQLRSMGIEVGDRSEVRYGFQDYFYKISEYASRKGFDLKQPDWSW